MIAGAPAGAALRREAAARLVILQGAVDPGLELRDEAAVSMLSGELDPVRPRRAVD